MDVTDAEMNFFVVFSFGEKMKREKRGIVRQQYGLYLFLYTGELGKCIIVVARTPSRGYRSICNARVFIISSRFLNRDVANKLASVSNLVSGCKNVAVAAKDNSW